MAKAAVMTPEQAEARRKAATERLRQHIGSSGRSVPQFASDVGVNWSTIYRWLSGAYTPQIKTIAKVEAATNGAVRVEDFFDITASGRRSVPGVWERPGERARQRERLKARWGQAEYREYTVAAAVEGLLASRRRMLMKGPRPDRERLDAEAADAAGIKVPDGARPVALTRGAVALVDADDYESVATFRWVAMISSGHRYAARAHQRSIGETRTGGQTSQVWMHRFILKPPPGMMVDHINGDGFDNRRSNLRVCNQFQNAQNRGPTAGGRKYKGIFPTPKGRWQAFIGAFGVRHYLGTFDTEIEAAVAYDRAALRLHKEFARLNIPESSGHAEYA